VVAALQTGTGNAYCWGNNGNGQLGNNTENGASSPVSVVGGRSFTTIFTNSNATWALDGSGFAWAWGNNPVGQLGNNTTNFASSPVSVVGGLKFSQMSCGDNGTFIVAIQSTTGNAYAWGTATSGCLGNNSTATQSSPVSVFGGRSYSSFACGGSGTFVVAIEGSTGNAYAWGAGTDGQLGNNSNVNASTPVSVVGGRSFKQVSVTYFGTAGAIEASTGNAYCWGLGTTGQLGNNTFGSSVFASSPVSVFGGRSYSYILVSEGFTAAIEASTGHVYSWGSVSEGMLANGADSFACSPVLVTTVPNF
jgi:alpha-tubulin suppressor-like RCC1 family protein